MTAYLNDTIVLFGLFALVFLAFLFFTLRRPYRVSNSFLLLLSLLLLVPALVSLCGTPEEALRALTDAPQTQAQRRSKTEYFR